MNDTERTSFQRPLDLLQWLDLRIAQRVEQRLAQEHEYWRSHVVDLIAAEREQLAALVQEEHRKVIDWVTADHKKVADLVEWNHEQSKRLTAKVTESINRLFDRVQAKYAIASMCRPDDDSQPPPSAH